jgi:hypothetical protein
LDAVVVEPVVAGEDGDVGPQWGFVHADAAVGLAAVAEILLHYLPSRQRVNGFLGGGTRGVAGLVLVHQLGDDAIECLLGVNCVSVLSARWHAQHIQQFADPERTSHRSSTSSHTPESWACADKDWTIWAHDGHASTRPTIEAGKGTDVHEHLRHHALHVIRLMLKRLWSIRISGEEVAGIGGCDCEGVAGTASRMYRRSRATRLLTLLGRIRMNALFLLRLALLLTMSIRLPLLPLLRSLCTPTK